MRPRNNSKKGVVSLAMLFVILFLVLIAPVTAEGQINLTNTANLSPAQMSKTPILLTLDAWTVKIVANFDPEFIKDGVVIGFVNLDGEKGWVPFKKGDFIQVEDRKSFSGKGWLIPNIKEPNKYIELKY